MGQVFTETVTSVSSRLGYTNTLSDGAQLIAMQGHGVITLFVLHPIIDSDSPIMLELQPDPKDYILFIVHYYTTDGCNSPS